MTISLVNGNSTTALVSGQARNDDGSPVGPANLRMSEVPGVIDREYVGADRVECEHVRCDHGSVTFDVTRTFETVDDALDYLSGGFLSEAKEGALKFNDSTVFPHAAVKSRIALLVGCSIAISYTIEG